MNTDKKVCNRPHTDTEKVEITFIADEKLMAKLQKIKNLVAHRDSKPTYAKLIHKMADLMLLKLDRTLKTTALTKPHLAGDAPDREPKSRHIPESIRTAVWIRDQGRCTYQNRENLKKCESEYQLELDHIRPYEMGGNHELKNLRLRCRAHNLLHIKRCS